MALDLEADLRTHILGQLSLSNGNISQFERLETFELCVVWQNWSNRYVEPRPRIVHVSETLEDNPILNESRFSEPFNALKGKIAAGENLTPHLSRGIVHISNDPAKTKKGRKRPDLDLLLNDWGIHHLHLSTVVEKDGFVERTGPLLFALFHFNDAYLVNIYDHNQWSCYDTVEILVREWGGAGVFREMHGAMDSQHQRLTDEQLGTLRQKHMSTHFSVDGKLYLPLGLTSAGTSTVTTLRINHGKFSNQVQRPIRTLPWEDSMTSLRSVSVAR